MYLVILVVSLFFISTVFAEVETSSSDHKIKFLGFLGQGIATSPSDAMDFMMVKAGIATVSVDLLGETVDATVGVLYLDDVKYSMKNVVIADGHATADIYLDDVDKGTIDVSSVLKGTQEVWAGTLVLDGTTYHMYILQGTRVAKAPEIAEKVKDYCDKNEDANCRERISEFCTDNSEDERCKTLFRNYCRDNLDDSRCREAYKTYCVDHPEEKVCRLLEKERTENYCEEHPNADVCDYVRDKIERFCSEAPEDESCLEFCKDNPNKCLNVVKSLAEYCVNNADDAKCIDYCKEHTSACKKFTERLVNFCKENPDNDKCAEYCKEHPVVCKKVTEVLAKYCVGNADNERCAEFCKDHPTACRIVEDRLEDYCEDHPSADVCEKFCVEHPDKCDTTEDEVDDINDGAGGTDNNGNETDTDGNSTITTTCGNGVCEEGEANVETGCSDSDPTCLGAEYEGTCPADCASDEEPGNDGNTTETNTTEG